MLLSKSGYHPQHSQRPTEYGIVVASRMFALTATNRAQAVCSKSAFIREFPGDKMVKKTDCIWTCILKMTVKISRIFWDTTGVVLCCNKKIPAIFLEAIDQKYIHVNLEKIVHLGRDVHRYSVNYLVTNITKMTVRISWIFWDITDIVSCWNIEMPAIFLKAIDQKWIHANLQQMVTLKMDVRLHSANYLVTNITKMTMRISWIFWDTTDIVSCWNKKMPAIFLEAIDQNWIFWILAKTGVTA